MLTITPKRLILMLAACIFIGEAAIMFILESLPQINSLTEMLIDAILLTLFCCPLLYFFAFRPLSNYVHDLQQAKNKLAVASVAFNSSEAILITDSSANIILVNSAFVKITGYSQDEVMGKNPRFLKSNRHDEYFYKSMWHEILSKDSWSGDVWNQHKDGHVFPVQMVISAIKNDENETSQYVCVKLHLNLTHQMHRILTHP